jgi:hypothetical protein
MIVRRRMLSMLVSSIPLAGILGCGGSSAEKPKTVEVTDEMKRQAEASDAFITEQSKQKKTPSK